MITLAVRHAEKTPSKLHEHSFITWIRPKTTFKIFQNSVNIENLDLITELN